MTSIPGVDYAWSHPGGAALQAAGKKFACRYLSGDASKNLTRAEADDLAAHDVWSVVVWETVAKRPLSGRAAGIADAQTAATQAKAAGMPSGRPIYFAVDFDATEAQQPAISAYFEGVASVIGLARTGGYGGYWVIKRLFDAGLIRVGWQTIAWSGGLWDARAVIRQGTQTRINGVSCDLNTATAADYGQWMPGKTPTLTPATEDSMPLSKDDITAVAKATADTIRWYQVDDPFKAEAGQTTLGSVWWETATRVAKLGAQPAPSATALTDTQIATIADRLAASPSFASAIAEQVAVKLAARLQS